MSGGGARGIYPDPVYFEVTNERLFSFLCVTFPIIRSVARFLCFISMKPCLTLGNGESVYFRSFDTDGGRTIRSAISEDPMLHANFTALSSTEPELLSIEVDRTDGQTDRRTQTYATKTITMPARTQLREW